MSELENEEHLGINLKIINTNILLIIKLLKENKNLELANIVLNLQQEEHNKINKLIQIQLEIEKLIDFLKQLELRQSLIEFEQLIISI